MLQISFTKFDLLLVAYIVRLVESSKSEPVGWLIFEKTHNQKNFSTFFSPVGAIFINLFVGSMDISMGLLIIIKDR